ncbi:MAG: Rdx family protein [Chloroflexota bacterium]|nr:Rdx family protein [Chloroflexota bacterium]
MTDELLLYWEPVIESLTLVPATDGRFEVIVDGKLIFSKKELGRHAKEGEVLAGVRPLAEAAEAKARTGD